MVKVVPKIILILLCWSSFSAHAFDVAQEASKREWLDRLFYLNGQGLVRSQDFYISPEGRENPVKELQATVDLLRHGNLNFACKFPGRFSYLAPKLGIDVKKIFCEDFESWRDSFEASGLSIMFASLYLENPASSFGHTYLKVNSQKKSLYLNKVISFAAAVPENVGAGEYIWKGLTGGFQGAFNESPFYILFQEYANMEKRDIWEYELNITEEETNNLLAILYEIVHKAKFDYKFISDNCSSLLLRLIDIQANKSLHQALPFYVIPIETVKVLEKKGMVKRAVLHPSITSRMALHAQSMSAPEVKDFVKYIDKNEKLSEASTATTLDLGLEYLNFIRQKNAGVLPPEKKKDFEHYLFLRSKHPEEYHPALVQAPDPIKASHPKRLSIGGQVINHDPVGITLAYRPVGKDFYDRPNGYAKESEINLLKTKLYLNTQNIDTSWINFDVIGIRKFADYNLITKNYSWGGNLALKNRVNEDCFDCYYTEIDSHLGFGKSFFKHSVLSYLVFHPTIRLGNISHHANLLPQLEGGLIKSTEDYVWKASAFHGFIYDGYDQRYFSNLKSSFSRILSNEFSLNLNHEYYHQGRAWNSLELGMSFYFQ